MIVKAEETIFYLPINTALNKASNITCKEKSMFKAIKEFFTGKKAEPVAEAPYKIETAPVAEPVQPVVEAKVDAVAVALDLEPMAVAAVEPAKKPRKPRAPKATAEKAAKPKKAAAPKAPKKSKKA